ncbi:protein of unknown function [Vibrio tapetis subsp. tapetis]|uniref:Uncharacterized protein n=1 Tax=Vibrio tapetis subsp. tapetis TaxID=1671868 RepID=A0A2N8ZJP2_9VIBR|nr:protein of unknown function [Vibrio tapetis subsp. tapetis]
MNVMSYVRKMSKPIANRLEPGKRQAMSRSIKNNKDRFFY